MFSRSALLLVGLGVLTTWSGCGDDSNPASATLESDFFFRSQEDVEEFAARGSNLRIQGGVVVENAVVSLAGLSGITIIEGSLDIRRTATLTDLRGLDNLTSIGGALRIKENERLRKAVSDLTLDKLILTEASRGN